MTKNMKKESRMLIQENTLNQMFERSPDKSRLFFNACCQNCGRDVTIEIHYLSSGYGLSGGVIYEAGSNRLVATCEKCYQINHDPADINE
jgi:hypothetical protein